MLILFKILLFPVTMALSIITAVCRFVCHFSGALLGIAHAAVQNRLSRVIAYSSVENSGLIITGFGVALTGAAGGTGG